MTLPAKIPLTTFSIIPQYKYILVKFVQQLSVHTMEVVYGCSIPKYENRFLLTYKHITSMTRSYRWLFNYRGMDS